LVTFSIHFREGMDPDQQNAAIMSARYYMPYLSPDNLLAGFEHYNDIIQEIANETGAILIDNENSIPGDPIPFVDSVHFTDKGSQLQAKRVVAGLMASNAFLKMVARYQH